MPRMRMSHIGICVSDRVRSLRFYHDLLGFRFVSELKVAGAPPSTLLRLQDVELRAIYLEREGVRIELLYYEAPGHRGDGNTRPMNQLGLTHLSLRTDDLDATLAELQEAGVEVLSDTRIDLPQNHTKAVFISDPDGTLIELVEQPGD
jgi:catechol 2,3-dioxygenase-like lactoylglutathione lyase family enzyme